MARALTCPGVYMQAPRLVQVLSWPFRRVSLHLMLFSQDTYVAAAPEAGVETFGP
eukprot:COSAG06_NODE_53254_length_301_cov_0.752475_1_plen_54_part_10